MTSRFTDAEVKRSAVAWWELRRLWSRNTAEITVRVPLEIQERADDVQMDLDELSTLDALATAIYSECQDAEEAWYFIDYFRVGFADNTHPINYKGLSAAIRRSGFFADPRVSKAWVEVEQLASSTDWTRLASKARDSLLKDWPDVPDDVRQETLQRFGNPTL
ncbi:hypothetical protein [Timonella senegalensis]|uniref:hypothetical protein n=1 Tax=Timonella senegalensis TaxID=1465825 RepID=UPI0028ACA12A|nr:hypothetical protein [Timonella senegalensis]